MLIKPLRQTESYAEGVQMIPIITPLKNSRIRDWSVTKIEFTYLNVYALKSCDGVIIWHKGLINIKGRLKNKRIKYDH